MIKSIITVLVVVSSFSTYGNIANDILMSRTPEQKTQILSNIVNAAGVPCTPIVSFFQGLDTLDAAYWNIDCSNGKSFVIQIANDDDATTTVFQCSAMRSLGMHCFKRLGN